MKGEDEKFTFPHLFHDEDSSLFQPDQCYENEKI